MSLKSPEITPPAMEHVFEERFENERITNLTEDYLQENIPPSDKRFAISVISANDPKYGDIPRSVECRVFAEAFSRTLTDVYDEYQPYNQASNFLVAFDKTEKNTKRPYPAGAIRVINNSPLGLKSIVDFVEDSPLNPWREEIEQLVFEEGEEYDPATAWQRLCQREGANLDPDATLDVATYAVHKQYRLRRMLSGVYVKLYHSCLRYALANGIENYMSIQDLGPFELLQSYGKPFKTFKGVKPHPYGGPFDTIPAYCLIKPGMDEVRRYDAAIGSVIIDGVGLELDTLLLEDQYPNTYGSKALGLSN